MVPVSPVISTKYPEVVYAKHQPEYKPLPSHCSDDGCVTTRWRLSWSERLRVLFGGCVWLQQLTFNKPLQPVKLSAELPKEFSRQTAGD